jgi:hypothetical protein
MSLTIIPKIVLLTICIIISVILVACASPHFTASKDFDIAAEQIQQKIPFRVGLYFPQGFKSYTQTLFPYRGDFVVGEALCGGSERIMNALFREVVLIDQPFAGNAQNVDLIVLPEVLRIDFINSTEVIFHANLRWNIQSPDGKMIYTNVIKGEYVLPAGKVFYAGMESPSKRSENFMKQYMIAIANQFQKAQHDIYSSSWWKNQWWLIKQ